VGIIDYSVLLGEIIDEDYIADINKKDMDPGVYLADDGKVYLLGVIDILTEYNGKKRMEYMYKRVQYGQNMSCIPPIMYRNRFLEYMKRKITTAD